METQELIIKYYGLDPEPAQTGCGVRFLSPELKEIYREFIPPCENDAILLEAFQLLSEHFPGKEKVIGKDSLMDATAKYRREDLLRLYIFANENEKGYGKLSIRSRNGSVRLANCCNWFWNDMFRPYAEMQLPEIKNTMQAKKELLTGQPGRGRRPNDARIPVLIWGTYKMLTDLHGFNTPMPNCLCNFIIRLLQFMEILPEDTDIDSLWVRAELRYIKSKKEPL